MNAWLRQIHTRNPLYVPGAICDAHDLKDGDWVWLISSHSRIKVEIARTDAANRDTIWTWNAIGKRKGAWALSPDAPEAARFPAQPSDQRTAAAEGRRHALVEFRSGDAGRLPGTIYACESRRLEPGEESEPRFNALYSGRRGCAG
jgi:anaerobic selenocysteine-containing dehydrogenase